MIWAAFQSGCPLLILAVDKEEGHSKNKYRCSVWQSLCFMPQTLYTCSMSRLAWIQALFHPVPLVWYCWYINWLVHHCWNGITLLHRVAKGYPDPVSCTNFKKIHVTCTLNIISCIKNLKRELQISVFPLPFVKINASHNYILILGLIVHHLYTLCHPHSSVIIWGQATSG